MIATSICASEAAGMANRKSVSRSKRMVRILNPLAGSSFVCPIEPLSRRGLRGVNGDASGVMDKDSTGAPSPYVHYGSLLRVAIDLLTDSRSDCVIELRNRRRKSWEQTRAKTVILSYDLLFACRLGS